MADTRPARDGCALRPDRRAPRRSRAATDLDTALGAIAGRPASPLGRRVRRSALQDPDEPGLELAARSGSTSAAIEARPCGPRSHTDSAPPHDRGSSRDRRTVAMRRGRAGRSIASRGGIDGPGGAIAFGWRGAPRRGDEARSSRRSRTSRRSPAIGRGSASMVAERSEWFERMAHTRPADRPRERADVRAGSSSSRSPAPRARAARSRSRCSTSTASPRRTTTAGHEAGDDVLRRSRRSSPSRSASSTPSPAIGGDEFVLVAPGSAGVTVARRVLDGHRGAAGRRMGGRSRVSAGVARFPTDGTDAEGLLGAAHAALERRTAGRGVARGGRPQQPTAGGSPSLTARSSRRPPARGSAGSAPSRPARARGSGRASRRARSRVAREVNRRRPEAAT